MEPGGSGARVGTAAEFTEPGRGHRGRGGLGQPGGQGGILMIFLWQLMANYGEFQVDLFGDYLDGRTDGHALVSAAFKGSCFFNSNVGTLQFDLFGDYLDGQTDRLQVEKVR